ncbi:MAG: tyrosine--tRNA ligase [Candidatus Norongarragalinales archaeon]
MDVETKLELALQPPTEEVVTRDELRALFETNAKPRHYIGFEASGLLHIGSLVVAGLKIRDLQHAGCECVVFLADWHSLVNKKLGEDWKKIQGACEYYREAFEFFCPGVRTVLGSELYSREYWEGVLRFSREITLARAVRCLSIMGRSEKEKLDLAQYFYPSMQSVDMKWLGVDLAHAGSDQRKVHMLAREVFPKMGWKPPVALHHALLPGLAKPEKTPGRVGGEAAEAAKMSKSKPWTCVFVHDSREEIERKLEKAYCPPKTIEGNPVLAIAKNIVFHEKKELRIERDAKFGGDACFSSYAELEKAFKDGALHPADLKLAVARELDCIVAPVRKHFEKKRELLRAFED